MAPFWDTSVKKIFKRSKKHGGQAGKPSENTAASSGSSTETSKLDQHARVTSAYSEADDRVASGQLPPATVPPISSPQATPPAPGVSVSQPASSGSTSVEPSSLRGPLWNQAYDELKAKEPNLVDAYERILSRKLNNGELSPADSEPLENEIEQKNPEKRRSQMTWLTRAGLDKTEKEAAVKQGIEDGMQAVHAVRRIIDRAVKASPEAALAWVGVCFVLEILANPISEAVANRSGLAYVISRMDWYWNLSDLLLDKHRVEKAAAGLRDELEKHVLDLYKMLLAYQMRSICSYYRNRGVVFLRDMIKLDDWDGRLKSIKDAEETVQTDSDQFNTVQVRFHLQSLVNAAGSEERKLQNIFLAIERQITQQRKMQEEDAYKECIQALFHTDPHLDKKRIEETKGGLLADSYSWVLDNTTFQQWQRDPNSRLLWVKGDPGKGKTMLLCGIVDELQSSMPKTALLSYFFCQATDPRIDNATAVLRGLLYMLVKQQPSLIFHVRERHKHAGKALFEGPNAWVALTEIFVDVLRDPNLSTTYLIIDALDECTKDRKKLLEFVAQQSSTSDRVKWIVSSRNWSEIEAQLERAGHKVKLSLELNAKSVAAAVDVFIHRKVDQLAQTKEYDEELRHAVLQQLTSKADDTFLWVALVCQELESTENWGIQKKLALFPSGLNSLYKQMMEQISGSESAEICLQVLASTVVLYRPVTIPELIVLTEQLARFVGDLKSVRKIVSLCGSFLTVREDTIYFVHQSAKDFLLATALDKIFPHGTEDVHRAIFSNSLATLSRTLHRDMYSLKEPGCPIENAKPPDLDPLAASQYSCVYWIDHLCDSKPVSWANSGSGLQVADVIDGFLRKKYLYWLEGLSLCKSIAKGVVSMVKLRHLVEIWNADELQQHVQDAQRFIMYHRGAIESYPLQVYASALLFSPTKSLIRRLFQHEEPKGITIKPSMSDEWSACLQTLEGHSDWVRSVAFSPDSTRLASASNDHTVKIWDASSGACLHTLEGHSREVRSVAFSPDSTRLASASNDHTVKIWDASSGACLHTLEGHSNYVNSVAFSPDSTRLASASNDHTVKIWDASSGACLQTLNTGKTLYDLSFDAASSCLYTEIGAIVVQNSQASISDVVEPKRPLYLGIGVNSDSIWIQHAGKNMLWIPSEYRSSCSAVSGNTVGIGVGSGRVWSCSIDLEHE